MSDDYVRGAYRTVHTHCNSAHTVGNARGPPPPSIQSGRVRFKTHAVTVVCPISVPPLALLGAPHSSMVPNAEDEIGMQSPPARKAAST